mgnify:CR=1 FL=1
MTISVIFLQSSIRQRTWLEMNDVCIGIQDRLIDAKYISPEFDSAASESYKERIRKDIFNISNIPDMSDQNFAGNTTGVAMLGFEIAFFSFSRGKMCQVIHCLT